MVGAYDGDTAPRLQAPWAFTHRTLYVAARAPNRCAWWTKTTLTTCLDDAPESDRDVEGKNAEAFVQTSTPCAAGGICWMSPSSLAAPPEARSS